MGVACGAKKRLCVTLKMIGSRDVGFFVIKMLECSFGVACGDKKCLQFTPNMTCSHYFCFWVARWGKKLKHGCQKTIEIIENNK